MRLLTVQQVLGGTPYDREPCARFGSIRGGWLHCLNDGRPLPGAICPTIDCGYGTPVSSHSRMLLANVNTCIALTTSL